jgi:hypothetical protein
MTPARSERRTPVAAILALLIAALLLPLLYVLSAGPFVYVYGRNQPPQWLLDFYGPLEWLANTFDFVHKFLDWYLEFWQSTK